MGPAAGLGVAVSPRMPQVSSHMEHGAVISSLAAASRSPNDLLRSRARLTALTTHLTSCAHRRREHIPPPRKPLACSQAWTLVGDCASGG